MLKSEIYWIINQQYDWWNHWGNPPKIPNKSDFVSSIIVCYSYFDNAFPYFSSIKKCWTYAWQNRKSTTNKCMIINNWSYLPPGIICIFLIKSTQKTTTTLTNWFSNWQVNEYFIFRYQHSAHELFYTPKSLVISREVLWTPIEKASGTYICCQATQTMFNKRVIFSFSVKTQFH